MRASRGLKWENKMYKPKRSIEALQSIKSAAFEKEQGVSLSQCVGFFLGLEDCD